MKILYLSSILPKRSETFVYREVLGLRGLGITVETASLHQPENELGDPELDAMAANSIRVYPGGAAAILRDAIAFLRNRPARAAGVVALAMTDAVGADDLTPSGRLKVIPQSIAALALARRLEGLGLTHIHVHMAHAAATVGMYAAWALGLPFSMTGHAADLFRERCLLGKKLQRASFVVCISHWHRAWYSQIYPRRDADYPVIRCGVDVPGRPFPPRTSATLNIFSLGRLVPKKGFDVLVEAVRQLVALGVPVRAVIAGDGPESARLKTLAEGLPVEFPGPVSNREVPDWLAMADIFALPCRVGADGDRDGIPVVLMEAMAHGVCCISGDLPTIRELIMDRVSGLLIPPGDVSGLVDALLLLFNDPELRRRLAAEGRKHVEEEFSSAENLARLQHSFESHTSPNP